MGSGQTGKSGYLQEVVRTDEEDLGGRRNAMTVSRSYVGVVSFLLVASVVSCAEPLSQDEEAKEPSTTDLDAAIDKSIQDIERAAREGRLEWLKRRPTRLTQEDRARIIERLQESANEYEVRMDLGRRLQELDTESVVSARDSCVAICLEWLRGEDKYRGGQEVTEKCIWFLGEMRAPEGVPYLTRRILFQSTQTSPGKDENLRDVYPAFDALVKIGKASVAAAIEALIESAAGSKEWELYALIVEEVEGSDVGRFVLQRAADAETDPARRGKVEAALELLDDK
jgi:hypothetical protein